MIKNLPKKIIQEFKGYDNHQRLIGFEDNKVGLRGYIAIHNTNLGPATGGTRFKVYKKEKDAIYDALNLSRAMTYKCAMAGVPFGGGKAVIMDNGKKDKALLESYANIINSLGGEFTTGKDAGIDDEDIGHMSKTSSYINNRSGLEDPSIYAAFGVFLAIKAAAKKVYGSDSLNGRKVSIKGLGQVGFELARLLYEAGGILTVSDIDGEKLKQAKEEFGGIKLEGQDNIHKVKADIYAPCALGAEFSKKSIAELNCNIICGAANNQLVSADIGLKLMRQGIVYVPDYIANAGGLIAVVDNFQFKKSNKERVKKKLLVIKDNVNKVLDLSSKQKRATEEVANEMAESIFKKKVKL